MAKAKRIFFIRHGQSLSNVDGSARGTIPDHKIPLTDHGHKQAREAGAKLRALVGEGRVAVYVSPFLRTRQTADGVLSAFAPEQIERRREDPQLREQEWGNYMDEAEYAKVEKARIAHGTFFYRLKDGESGADVYSRAALFLDSLHRDFDKPYFPENVIIVTHGYTLRMLLMRWLHWTVEEMENTKNPANCQFFEMRLKPDNHYELTETFAVRDVAQNVPPTRGQKYNEMARK